MNKEETIRQELEVIRQRGVRQPLRDMWFHRVDVQGDIVAAVREGKFVYLVTSVLEHERKRSR